MDTEPSFVDTSQEKNLSAQMKASYVALEAQAIKMLLTGDGVVLEQLRSQWELSTARSRMFSGTGFFTEFALPEHIARTSPANFEIGDVAAWVSGIQIGMLLFVREGAIAWFEAYTFDEPWPDHPVLERLAFHSADGSSSDTRDASYLARLLTPRNDL